MSTLFQLAATLAAFADLAYLTADEIDGSEAVTGYTVLHLRNGNAQAFLAFTDDKAYLAIAGSNDGDDWRHNLNVVKIPINGDDAQGHQGVIAHAALLAEELNTNKQAEEICATRQVYLCGHSLGGAAAIVLPYLVEWLDPRRTYTFGSPRCLGRRTAGVYPHGGVVRFVSLGDVVPMLPLPIRYAHLGDTRYFNTKGTFYGERMWSPVGLIWRFLWTHLGAKTPSWLLHRRAMKSINDHHDRTLYVAAAQAAAEREKANA